MLYVWSPLMPLSRMGIAEGFAAAAERGLAFRVIEGGELRDRAAESNDADATVRSSSATSASGDTERRSIDALLVQILAVGATVHYPAIVLHRGGELVGGAIVGYKTAETYRAMFAERLTGAPGTGLGGASVADAMRAIALAASLELVSLRDYPVQGRPGPYFKWVAGRNAIAFEAASVDYALGLTTGRTAVVPGTVDFVPSPDGRFFATPETNRRGLEFYDAAEVFEAAARGEGRSVEPFWIDREMRDQYPSIGILERRDGSTVYRVLTSWFDRIVFRDYVVTGGGEAGDLTIRPVTGVIPGCRGSQVSTPIVAQNGREVAGRDERTKTTKIYALADDGGCTEVVDLGLQTGKVAWHATGRRIAFAIPRGAAGPVGDDSEEGSAEGIFVYDRASRGVTRVPDSEQVSRITFPEFVGADSLMFLIAGRTSRDSSRFRLVCCIR